MTETWRFIDSGTCSASYNMALDEAISTGVRTGNLPPTLRLYGWDRLSVSIGYFQKIENIDSDYCIRKGIPVVRRPTGGRAILHNCEITYSFSVKTNSGVFSKGLIDSYKKVSRAFQLAFSRIGLLPELKLQREPLRNRSTLCFQSTSYGEITINSRKVIGSAQKRWTDGLLQQGSIPYILDQDEIPKIFKLKSYEPGKEFAGLQNILPDLSMDRLKDAIKTSFEETFDILLIPSFPSPEEISFANDLEARKYLSPLWNLQR